MNGDVKYLCELAIDLTSLSLIRFIKKTALGLPWKENSLGGRPPYLNPTDLEELKRESETRCKSGSNYIELEDFLDIALELKVNHLSLICIILYFILRINK